MTESTHMNSGDTLNSEIMSLIGDLFNIWRWILALGILFILLGVVGLGMSVTLTIVSVMLYGVLLLIGGVFQIVDAFKLTGWKGKLLHILIGLLYIAAGVMLVTRPQAGSLVLTVILGVIIFAVGILRIIMGFQLKGAIGSWGIIIFSGVVSLILGGMILFQWPASSLWVIGLFVAIEMIMHGWSYVLIALSVRSMKQIGQ